ncbi:unnamed protein product, partial [Polarella glacialis]
VLPPADGSSAATGDVACRSGAGSGSSPPKAKAYADSDGKRFTSRPSLGCVVQASKSKRSRKVRSILVDGSAHSAHSIGQALATGLQERSDCQIVGDTAATISEASRDTECVGPNGHAISGLANRAGTHLGCESDDSFQEQRSQRASTACLVSQPGRDAT